MADAQGFLNRVNEAANDVQALAYALAEKIRAGGDVAIRTSNTVTGAAGGAKAGSMTPVTVPPVVKYGAAAALVYFLVKRR